MAHVLWVNTVDEGKFEVSVSQSPENPNRGYLLVHVLRPYIKEIYRENVSISYEARYGAEVSDISSWQTSAIAVIDQWYLEQGAL